MGSSAFNCSTLSVSFYSNLVNSLPMKLRETIMREQLKTKLNPLKIILDFLRLPIIFITSE